MPEFAQILVLALLPAIGNFAGGVLAELLPTSSRVLNWALHGAAGIVLAVVGVELLPTGLEGAPAWMIVLALAAGAGLFLLIKTAVGAWQARRGTSADAGPWVIYIAVAVDLFSDGLMIGAGSTVSFSLALVLALGQVTADLPEGFATVAIFKERGVPRARRLLLAASFVVPILLGAMLSYWALRDLDRQYQLAALALTAGLLLTAAVEDIVGEAHEAREDTPWSAGFLIAGFGLFTLLAEYLA